MSEGKKIRDQLEKLLPHPPEVVDWKDGFIYQSERFNDWLGEIAKELPRRIRAENKKIVMLEKECRGEKTQSGRRAAFAAAAKKLSRMKENHQGLFGITFHFNPGPVNFDEDQIAEAPNFQRFLKTCEKLDVRLHCLMQNAIDDDAGIDIRTHRHKLGDIYFIIDASLPFYGSELAYKLEVDEDEEEEAPSQERDPAHAITAWVENPAIPRVPQRQGSDIKRGKLRLVSPVKTGNKPVL